MTKKKTTTVSIANTPVQRALARAKRSTLLIMFAVGIVAGLVYKTYFADKQEEAPQQTVTGQQ